MMKSHPVRVNALHMVVSITTLEDSTPSCPIFFAMTKLLTVVAEPSMTKIAISFSLRNPITTASGMNTATNPTNFDKCGDHGRFDLAKRFLNIKGCSHCHQSHRCCYAADTADRLM